jgi:hypothetical protein
MTAGMSFFASGSAVSMANVTRINMPSIPTAVEQVGHGGIAVNRDRDGLKQTRISKQRVSFGRMRRDGEELRLRAGRTGWGAGDLGLSQPGASDNPGANSLSSPAPAPLHSKIGSL